MAKFIGFEHGMGIGGWLTNYKRFNVLPENRRLQFTVGDIEHFETYITEEDIKYIKSLGMDHIRLGFDQIVVEKSPYEYNDKTFKLIENFVDWCVKYELNIVLNLHKAVGNYCDIKEDVELLDNDEYQNRFIALWLEFEHRFSAYQNIAFELLNEVRDVDPQKWNNLAEKCIVKIREQNKTRKIIIGSTAWNSPDNLKYLKLYDDPNIIYTFHAYRPFEFTHQRGVLQPEHLFYNRIMPYPGDIERYRDYMRTVKGISNPYPNFEVVDAEFVEKSLQHAFDFAAEHPDKIVWCGEFGTIRHANITWRENWMRDVISALKKHNISYCVWNYLSTPNDGNRFSLVDDDNRKILSPRMAEIIKGNV